MRGEDGVVAVQLVTQHQPYSQFASSATPTSR
jgi:hypothetical protein